eukprot:TRINITY_DN22060_c2_g1_i2.p1 TRINITY_DN22060_c2_g1~~TRINITY_DN22060_c2_g1_i2.p1  ORF type:complete len:328 (+),score=104.24 TRINITY_DN22060_c2_g1_i2:107-1090(+)
MSERALHDVYVHYCGKAAGPKPELDGARFAKMCKECGLIDTAFTVTDADIAFAKVRAPAQRRIGWKDFKTLLEVVAGKKEMQKKDLTQMIIDAAAPLCSGEAAAAQPRAGYTGRSREATFSRLAAGQPPQRQGEDALEKSGASSGGRRATVKAPAAAASSPVSQSTGRELRSAVAAAAASGAQSPRRVGSDRPASKPALPAAARRTVKPDKPEQPPQPATWAFVEKKKPATADGGGQDTSVRLHAAAGMPVGAKSGFELVAGLDVTSGRLVDDDDELVGVLDQQQQAAKLEESTQASEYQRAWRGAHPQQTTKFAQGMGDLAALDDE